MNTLNRMARGFVFHVMLELGDGSEWLVTFTVHSVLWYLHILTRTVLGMFSMCVIWSILLTRRGQLRLGSSLGSRSASGSVVSGIHTPEEEACRTVLCQKPFFFANLCCLFGTTGLTNDETMLTSSFFFATYFESIYFLKVSLGEQSGGASSEPLDEGVQGFIKFA